METPVVSLGHFPSDTKRKVVVPGRPGVRVHYKLHMRTPDDSDVGTSGRDMGQTSPAKRKRQAPVEQEQPGNDEVDWDDADMHDELDDGAAAKKERMQKKLKKYKDAYDRRGMQ